MALTVPKIIYNAGSGDVTLTFSYPPVKKPGADKKTAVRHDTDASIGIRQSIFERKEVYRTVQMDIVPFTDLAAWEAFFDYAITGGAFKYYVDSTSGTYEQWTLDDTDFDPKFAHRQLSSFKFTMRKLITA